MRIAFVIDIYNDYGNGTSKSARSFVEHLRELGHEVIVLCQSTGEEEKDVVGFSTLVIPFFQTIIEKQHAILAKPDDELIRKTLATVDIVHIYLPFWLGTHSARIASELGIPTLGCYHLPAESITYNIGLKNVGIATRIVYSFFKNNHFKAKWIKDIHCPSRYIANTIFRYHYYQNLHIISNGYNPDFKPMAVDKPEEYKDKIVILSVGRHTKEKRQDLIIKAISKSKYKDKIVLILAGSGPMTQRYNDMAINFKINCVMGFYTQADLIKIHNYSDLFIQASAVETESIACLEAIACGNVPIISDSKMCAAQQFALVKQSKFKNGKAHKLAKRIDYWIKNETFRKEMRAKYAESALQYSLEKSINSILEVYQSIINHKVSDTEQMIKDYNKPITIIVPRNKRGIPIYKFKKLLTYK